jgi:ABC-type transport system involved in cytochrome bd biosynthesis fused ATPase/permease subunit
MNSDLLWFLRHFAFRHRSMAVWAVAFSVLYVGVALTIPFVLGGLLQSLDPQTPSADKPYPLWLSLFSVTVVFLLLGLGDAGSRLKFSRFLLRATDDLRAVMLRGAAAGLAPEALSAGDCVTRWVSDVPRLKSNLFGFLVHSARNCLLIACVSVVLAVVDPLLGLVFAGIGAMIFVVSRSAAGKMRKRARRARERESAAVESMLCRWRTNGPDLPEGSESSRAEAGMASVEAATVLAVHCVFAVGISGACGLAAWRMDGDLDQAKPLILALSYGLMLHGAVVQLARHGARLGKAGVLAQRLHRAHDLLTETPESSVPAVRGEIVCREVVVRGFGRGGLKRLLRLNHLTIPPGAKILVKGKSGAGKTTLLRLLAGALEPDEGELTLAGQPLEKWRTRHAGLLGEEADWPPESLAALMGSTWKKQPLAWEDFRRESGLNLLIQRLPRGESAVLASRELSSGERGAVALAAVLGRDRQFLLLDEPFRCWGKTRAGRILKIVLDCVGDRTVVVASSRNLDVKNFDLVIRLKNGKLSFSGTPEEWSLHLKTQVRSAARNQTVHE